MYCSVRFKFEDDYYLTAACIANSKEEAFTKFTHRYPNCKINIEDIKESKNETF